MFKILNGIVAITGFLIASVSLLAISIFLMFPGEMSLRYYSESTPYWFIINLFLFLLFAAHHSIMARTSAKNRFFKGKQGRSRYLIVSGSLTLLMLYFWVPATEVLWKVENILLYGFLVLIHIACWFTMILSVLRINFWAFWGLDKIINSVSNDESLAAKWPYSIVRHPISTCWMVMCFSIPYMTLDKLQFAVSVVVYILCVTKYEEADLKEEIGEPYDDFCQGKGRFFPKI